MVGFHAATLMVLNLSVICVDAFTPSTIRYQAASHYLTPRHDYHHHMSRGADDKGDPTKTFLASFADGVQTFLKNPSLNEGKRMLVKSLAGDYDEDAVLAKLNGLISDNRILMMSFTT